jgi:hypothetical protein
MIERDRLYAYVRRLSGRSICDLVGFEFSEWIGGVGCGEEVQQVGCDGGREGGPCPDPEP